MSSQWVNNSAQVPSLFCLDNIEPSLFLAHFLGQVKLLETIPGRQYKGLVAFLGLELPRLVDLRGTFLCFEKPCCMPRSIQTPCPSSLDGEKDGIVLLDWR